MEIKNKIEIKKHTIIRDKGEEFAHFLNGEDKKVVLDIVEKSKKRLCEIGDADNVVYSPTRKEKWIFRNAVKKYVNTDFMNPALERIKHVSLELDDIDGICKKCLDKEKESKYGVAPKDMCTDCRSVWEKRSAIYYVQCDRSGMIRGEFDEAYDNTKFSNELSGNWMLLRNKINNSRDYSQLDVTLKKFIRNELMKEFANQNKQLLKKYQLWQNQ